MPQERKFRTRKKNPYRCNILRGISITLDSVRYDSVPKDFIEKWKRHLTIWTNMHTHFHSTVPSLTSMYTGVPPQWHGVYDHMQFYKYPLQAKTVFEILKEHEIKTAWLCDELMVRKAQIVHGVGIIETLKEALDFLKEDNTFLAIHLLAETHLPYGNAEVRRMLNEMKQFAWKDKKFLKIARDAQTLAINKCYRMIDYMIGTTGSNGLISSDHGEAFGEYGLFGHGEILHESVLKIPFLVIDPDKKPGVIDSLTYNSQAFRIILDWFGIDEQPSVNEYRKYTPWHQAEKPIDLDFPGGIEEEGEVKGIRKEFTQ